MSPSDGFPDHVAEVQDMKVLMVNLCHRRLMIPPPKANLHHNEWRFSDLVIVCCTNISMRSVFFSPEKNARCPKISLSLHS